MKVAISGRRELFQSDLTIIQSYMTQICRDADVEEIYFGGAIGADTEALRFALLERADRKFPILTVVVPDYLGCQPERAQEFGRRADRILELRHAITSADGYAAYRHRNQAMVDWINGRGQLSAFWDGVWKGGTSQTIRYAQEVGAAWEYIRIGSSESTKTG